jgi:hypothetical protein
MNWKRFWIAVIVIFLAEFGYEFLVHGMILNHQYYQALTPTLFLGENSAMRHITWLFYGAIFIAEFVGAFFFTYIFTRGVEDKGWLGEGFRYGVLIWGVAVLPANVGMYSWSSYPGKLLAWWIFYGLIEFVILGWICAAIYKKKAA